MIYPLPPDPCLTQSGREAEEMLPIPNWVLAIGNIEYWHISHPSASLHLCDRTLRFGEGFYAVPLAALGA